MILKIYYDIIIDNRIKIKQFKINIDLSVIDQTTRRNRPTKINTQQMHRENV